MAEPGRGFRPEEWSPTLVLRFCSYITPPPLQLHGYHGDRSPKHWWMDFTAYQVVSVHPHRSDSSYIASTLQFPAEETILLLIWMNACTHCDTDNE
ncbi:hypothetical protein ATANTOWER_027690 [Ataeniobius toweri]|uniref:Uncharacterized protein n=1 Tax=Ataeniobius toweri TaxID=208326 RepID=A0ABU7B0D0_9TELE|nr:hypothetical protein [Ataeniobius toweri]